MSDFVFGQKNLSLKDNLREIEAAIMKLYEAEIDAYKNFNVTARYEKVLRPYYQIEISQMYKHVPMDFAIMMKISKILNTQNFEINNTSARGCDTCDYGSSYDVNITVFEDDMLKGLPPGA